MPVRRFALLFCGVFFAIPIHPSLAFCGFYVAKADTRLFNEASKVVLARSGDRTVITMVNDYKGEPEEFAVVIPVPKVLERGQINVGDAKVVEHLDAYTAPRLVEYFDPDPCARPRFEMNTVVAMMERDYQRSYSVRRRSSALGVTIEARYTVGEYDILILSAEQSGGLATWLTESGYKLPGGVVPVLDDYIAKGMKFFVARVNLAEKSKLGFSYLRPLQIAFESPHFMLPIRLGMVNANGKQELFVFTLTRKGRVEAANYPNVEIPSGMDIPIFVKAEFGAFYAAMFANQTRKQDGRAVFLEYAWDMGWCDPCATDPLSVAELKSLGVTWIDGARDPSRPFARSMARDVFVTRLHLRYDDAHFPRDLMFRETSNRENFQGRYVLRHPWTGAAQCEAAKDYRAGLRDRFDREASQLAVLTNWPAGDIRAKMEHGFAARGPGGTEWWRRIWDKRD